LKKVFKIILLNHAVFLIFHINITILLPLLLFPREFAQKDCRRAFPIKQSPDQPCKAYHGTVVFVDPFTHYFI